MNTETLEETANEALKKIIEASTQAADWTVGQIPEVIEQLLMWHTAKSLIGFSIGGVILITTLSILVYTWCKSETLDNEEKGIITAFGGIPIFIGIMSIANNLEWIKIMIAPKLYLIEYAAEMLK